MGADEFISVDNQEVADPEFPSGVEEQDAADLAGEDVGANENVEPEENTKTEADTAFANLRRELELERRKNADLQQGYDRLDQALGIWFPDAEDKATAAEAYYNDVDYEDAAAQVAQQDYYNALEERNNELEQQAQDYLVEKAMADGLRDIQAIDPNIKNLTDLGEDFAKYIQAGLSSADAYWAVKSKEIKTKPIAPNAPGIVNQKLPTKDFFTFDEAKNMSPEEISANFDVLKKSSQKW